jgi:DNA-binding response OmpR family regulator
MAKVVLIEDDVEIRRLVAGALSEQGHDVESAGLAMDGLQLTVKGNPDLVLMDLGLPDLDGTELLRMIRSVSEVPIIVITARGADDVVVRTLDAGADDYLTKPFSLTQLEARVRAVLRRGVAATTNSPIRVGELTLDAASREATMDGDPLDLSPKEFDLLLVLAARSGDVVSKRELMAEVWREPYGGSERTVDVHLSWLRSKLGESAQEPRYLQTVHGVGVKLIDPTV